MISFYIFSREKNKLIILLLTFLLCLSVLGYIFIKNIRTLLVEDALSNLPKVTYNITDNLLLNLETRADILNSLVHIANLSSPALSLENKLQLIKHAKELKTFVRVGIADTHGRALMIDGSEVFVGDRSYYQTALKGQPAISDLINSRVSQEDQIIAQAVPVFNSQGQVINVVLASDNASNMTNSIVNIRYSMDAHAILTDKEGLIISQSKQGESIEAINLFDYLEDKNPTSIKEFQKQLRSQQIQAISCSINNQPYYLTYAPLKFQNIEWYAFVGVPTASVLLPAKNILAYTAFLVISIILILGLAFIYIYNLRRKYVAELKVSEYRYKIITEHTDNIILDWNIHKKSIYFSKSWYDKFAHVPPADFVGYQFPNVYTEDVHVIKSAIQTILDGGQPEEFDIRIFNKYKQLSWLNIHLTVIRDADDLPCRVIGILVDITDKKVKELQILDQAERDALSKLYNRHAFEERALGEFANSKDNNTALAFLFIDIDDFRYFNNNFGHAFGDRVISFIGSNLATFVDGIGFAGRIGGDEFAVCLTDPDSIDRVESLVSKLQAILQEGLHARSTDPKIQVGSSIGIITMPYPADTYSELIAKADEAMYHVKANGKGSFRRIHS